MAPTRRLDERSGTACRRVQAIEPRERVRLQDPSEATLSPTTEDAEETVLPVSGDDDQARHFTS